MKQSRLSHKESVLLLKTRELLANTDISYLDIYSATTISPNWLSLFVKGKIADPSVNRIEALYTYLSGAPLVIG